MSLANSICIDLCKTEYLDNPALGNIIRFKQKVGDKNIVLKIALDNSTRAILAIATFGKPFSVKAV